MAAIYDAQGNYMGDDGAPDLDQMKLELTKKNIPLSSQIPGYGKPVPPAQTKPDPLGAAAGNFTELATKFNPLMMMKSMQEAARTLNPAIPVAGAWADVAQNVQTAGAEAMYDILGNRKGIEKMQQNYVPVTTGRFYQEPTTQFGKEFESGVAKAMDESKIPAMWPMAMNQPVRPLLTPNDLRVMGAEATRVGRQVRDIPTDFYNAQSGLQKLDPITGQPTMGAKLQGVAESVGDVMAQREMQGLPPIPGLPASMQPTGPKLYAMRPEGSRIQTAVMPATAKQSSAAYSPAYDIVSSVIDSTTMTPVQALDEIQNKILAVPEAIPARKAFEKFIKQKAAEMYPDAPTPADAVNAYKARFSDREASAAHTLGMYDEFLQTPEGIQFRAALDLPSADELPAMHEAAANWLNSQFTNYILEKVGTPNEPAVKLAGQGLTFNPPEDVLSLADMSGMAIGNKRTYAGMPAKTAMDEALIAADRQLEDLRQQAADATVRKREQIQAAIDAGYGAEGGPNLGQYEPFAQASREANKATEAYKKQQKLVDNLRLGTAYENAVDQAISAPTAKELRNDLEYAEQQFYPSLMRTPDDERTYIANVRHLRNLGFEDLARKFYDDVMSRKIHLDKVPKMTVEKYIRQTAEERIDKERKEQAAVAAYKNAVDTQFKRSADAYIPNDKVFGNVGALEITDRFTPDEVAKLVSEDTTALDVCIGEGGTTSGRPNLWHPGTGNRQYEPIYNVATGERNPNATSPRTTYINAVRDGSQMVSFRDTVTGEPVAIFDFNPSSRTGRYNIHFASGRRNGKIKPEYVDGIKAYLNSRADSIHDVGDNLYSHTGISDSERSTNTKLAGMINMPISEFAKYDLSNLPRFITTPELRNYIENLKANEPAVQTPAIASQRPSESIEAYTSGAVASAIDNVLDSQRRQLTEAGEEFYIPAAEAFFADIRGYFNAYLDAQGPARALELTNQRLYDLESEYANNNRIGANIIAEGIVELIHTLGLQSEYVQNRMAAEATRQQPRAVAQRGDPIPDNLDAEDILGRYRDRLTPEQQQYLREFSQRWENTNYPDELSMEFNRWVQNNRLAPEGRPDYMRMAQDATATLTREMGADAGDEMRAVIRNLTDANGLDPAENTEAFVSGLRRAANVADRGTVEIALNELADMMESEFMRDWEPEVTQQPTAPAQRQSLTQMSLQQLGEEVYRLNAETADGVFARVNNAIDRRVNAATRQGLDPTLEANDIRQGIGLDNDITPLEREYIARIVEIRLNGGAPPAPPAPAQQFTVAGFDEYVNEVRQDISADQADNLIRIANTVADGMGTNVRGAIENRPDEFANRLADVAEMEPSILTQSLLRTLSTRIRQQQPAPAAQAPMQYRAPSQVEASTILSNVASVFDTAVADLRFEDANTSAGMLESTFPILLRENNLDDVTMDSLPEFGRLLQGLRDDIAAQRESFMRMGFDGEAAASAYANVVDRLDRHIANLQTGRAENLEPRRLAEVREMLDNPELDPDTLRTTANELQSPADGMPTAYWSHLAEGNRRSLAQQLRQRANYIEFNPRDFAQRVMNEEGAEHYDDAITLLENNQYDHEILRGLPPTERERAAQATALEMSRLSLNEAYRRLNPNGVPPEPAVTPRQRAIAARVPQITNMLIDFSTDDPLNTPADYRRIANILRDPRNAREFLENVMGVGDSIGDFTLRATDLQRSTLSLVADELESRADTMGNGGPVRGYQKGGSVKADVPTPWLFSVPTYSETVAYEMYPGQKGQDDQRDAARHMLAAGTLSRKYGPGVAEFMGKAHEYVTSPLQAVKSVFGGKMPADFGMDTHNNTVGAQLGQRAKSQAELEDLVQAEAERASRTQTPGQAFIKRANGGIVQQNPTTDQMRYALMMRRK